MKKLFLLLILSIFALMVPAQKTEIHYLSGTDKDHTVKWDFFCTKGMKSEKWSSIQVPSNWEFQGFGSFNYGQNEKVFNDEKGLYKCNFSVPKNSGATLVFMLK